MTKSESIQYIRKYLKQHFIKFIEDSENGTERITMVFHGYERCPDSIVEACIFFYEDSMECRTYYTGTGADWCSKSEYKHDLYRLLNYINARIFPTTPNDGMGCGLYKPSYMYTPRMYVTEEGCFDITLTYVTLYDFFEVAPLESMDYFTVSCPGLLDKLSAPIFFTLLNKINVNQAIEDIRREFNLED